MWENLRNDILLKYCIEQINSQNFPKYDLSMSADLRPKKTLQHNYFLLILSLTGVTQQ